MEILLAACLLAWAAGAQSEQAKLGISPAQRALIREQVRHDKAVRKIAEKHGAAAPTDGKVSLSKEPVLEPLTVPEAFRAGYRGHTPIARVATPMGRRAGGWAARGVAWGKDTGRSAMKEYRKRRKVAGEPDPAPVITPIPPKPTEPPIAGTATAASTEPPEAGAIPPGAPPMPTEPPTAGTAPPGVPPTEPPPGGAYGGTGSSWDEWSDVDDDDWEEVDSAPKAAEKTPDGAVEPPPGGAGTAESPESERAPEDPVETPAVVLPAPRPVEPAEPAEPAAAPEPAEPTAVSGPEPAVEPAAEPPGDGGSKTTHDDRGGVGRMASEVSYDSVMEESDELSLMCDDDLMVYARIKLRCEREIGRADVLMAQLKSGGVKAWIARCQEQYRQLLAQLEDLERNTISQGEAVVKAKALLAAGQGVYADIALDMETVEDRHFYISDQVDGEDTGAESETYETKGARA